MTPTTDTQIDLFTWARDLERENKRIAKANEERARRRGYLVFATDPTVSPDKPGYCEVYATEARTPNQAAAKAPSPCCRPRAPTRRSGSCRSCPTFPSTGA
jgi:hypothetical protein